ncbi:hypothetical protein GLOIN_2v1596508 [Rhizophagus irregularis DAOM 181602=DAOM 197198]|uniref:Rho-GAP domain-containing protein n=1 Tax=Rhizophagus irregularis (strain DAOM 181602 / DAOM 197198 / MUCL 43194) TaxID=747089 RepID=A0A2P4Q474_RHIID|nr:hypothetical protein GLOIN_2v1596508 [Rhizophagus irregularis DAOM 181602=DAOM 197198]POG72382.1 hypothetical protein GLOIN_2v1596508 [Rhizophagus irregularis DAOM 181602=DAOM 197198]|eukprot:XP_025179248.1 hypothetical protein GLOIN_2v1596508 [Rhizophagus irregularis DAOM 181602=DAOM 197198]
MLRGAKHILKKKTHLNNNGNKVSIKKTTTEIKEFGNNVTIEETHWIVKKSAEQIRLRGLSSVNIFKPTRIGDGGDEVKYLLNCLLNENISEFEDEIKNQDLNNIVSAMKWTLRHCNKTIIPYSNYESFDRLEQGINFDVHKGLFSNYFLNSIPNLNRDIVKELFDVCIQITTTTTLSSSISSSSSSSPTLTTHSDINTMNAQKIIKSLAFCLIGSNNSNDDDEKRKIFNNFDDAYKEWIKCSNACLHLFLAYLRELSIEIELPPHLTVLLDNYVELRKKAINDPSVYHQFQHKQQVDNNVVDKSQQEEREIFQSADGLESPERPEMLDNLNRRTIVRTSTRTPIEKNWKDFSRKGFKSFYLEPLWILQFRHFYIKRKKTIIKM